MINKNKIKEFCCEDPSLIENYKKAINDDSQVWHCHHRKETDEGFSMKQLKEMGLYFNRPASELIFLTPSEHQRLHKKGKKRPALSALIKGKPSTKYRWLTPDGEIKIMSAQNAKCHHPDWVCTGPIE